MSSDIKTPYPDGWNEGDTCVMITSRAKKYTHEFEIIGYDGRYFHLIDNGGRRHHASPARLFKSRAEAVASLNEMGAAK